MVLGRRFLPGRDALLIPRTPGGRVLYLGDTADKWAVDLGRRADQDRVGVSDCAEQFTSIGAVAVPDLEVRTECLDSGRAQLFGNQNDWFAHSGSLSRCQRRGGRTTLCGQRIALYPSRWVLLASG